MMHAGRCIQMEDLGRGRLTFQGGDHPNQEFWKMWKTRRARVPWRAARLMVKPEPLVYQTRMIARKYYKLQNMRFLSAGEAQHRTFRSRLANEVTPLVGNATKERPKGSAIKGIFATTSVYSGLPTNDLPLQVSNGLVLESLGELYKGPHEDKYWSQIQCGLQHPFPVGYTATKTYRGVEFKQTIEKGPEGPLFLVREVGKASYSADTPAKAWSLALANSQLKSTTRVHGRKHFGFDLPIVLKVLTQLDKEKLPSETTISKEQRESPQKEEDVDGKPNVAARDENAVASSLEGDEGKVGQQLLLLDNHKSVNQNRSEVGFPSSIRLRSVLMHRVNQNGVQAVPLLNSNHPGTRGLSEVVLTGLRNKASVAEGSLSSTEFALSRNNAIKQNTLPLKKKALKRRVSLVDTSLESILRKMDQLAPIDRHVGVTDKTSTNRGNLEKANTNNGERNFGKQKSSTGRLFSSPAHHSRSFVRDSAAKDVKRPGQTTSLANILEKWNDGEKFKAGERKFKQHLPASFSSERMLVSSPEIGELDQATKDIENRVIEWISGKEGQLSVLEEIKYLIANNSVGRALQILTKIHASGVHLHDAVFSVFFSFKFDTWQRQAITQVQDASVLICAPGGAGKFTVAARIMYQALVEGKRCLVVTPLESDAEEYQQYTQELFGEKNVGILPSGPGDAIQQNNPITVMNLQTLVTGLREGRSSSDTSWINVFEGVDLVVLDKFHTLGQSNIGSYWEEAILLLDKKIKIMALSLPLSSEDAREIALWIGSVHERCELVSCDTDPLPKTRFYFDKSGLHQLRDTSQRESISFSGLHVVGDVNIETSSLPGVSETVRTLLQQSDSFLPAAISFPSVEDCQMAANAVNEVMEGVLSPEEVLLVERRVADFLNENSDIQHLVNKDDLNSLSRGYSLHHGPKLAAWTTFVQGLVNENLVKIILGSQSTLSKSRILVRTMAMRLQSKSPDSDKGFGFISEIMELNAKAGRRGIDPSGNVIFVASNPDLKWENWIPAFHTPLSIQSYFRPSYSFLLNLLNTHSISEAKVLVESNFGDFTRRRQSDQELAHLETKVAAVKKRKEELVADLFQTLAKVNSKRLQDAATFTLVDVRVAKKDAPWTDYLLPGLLCAVLPGPSELLYVILDAENNFRLLPAGALDHVYSTEERLDTIYATATGRTLRVPPLPSKEKWKKSPGDVLEYISEGTTESQVLVELLLHFGVTHRKTEEEAGCREDIRSCDDLLSKSCERQESLSTEPSTSWTTSEKLIQVLEKADAIELSSTDTLHATLKPLGVLISKLHTVENELWYAMALSSSILKPLTAPELAGICSAFVSTSQEVHPESSGFKSSISTKDAPKRLRNALEKLENLRTKVEQLQGSDSPPVVLDGHAVATIHSLCRETPGQEDLTDNLNRCRMVDFIRKIIRLLQIIDHVWGRNTHVLSALQGTSGLHNLARRAAKLLQEVSLQVYAERIPLNLENS